MASLQVKSGFDVERISVFRRRMVNYCLTRVGHAQDRKKVLLRNKTDQSKIFPWLFITHQYFFDLLLNLDIITKSRDIYSGAQTLYFIRPIPKKRLCLPEMNSIDGKLIYFRTDGHSHVIVASFFC